MLACCRTNALQRFPVLTWLNVNGAALLRASQPLPGKLRHRSKHDEAYLALLAKNSPSGTLYIIDARPKAAARANHLQGGGTESSHYENCTLIYSNIGNIHVVRESARALMLTSQLLQQEPSPADIAGSHWLEHIKSILKAAKVCVRCLADKDSSVLVHCSDGWDRTAQITSLAQILLDPYARSTIGFIHVITKVWLG